MKKALSAVLAVVLVLGVCFSVPMIASANNTDKFTYELDNAENPTGYIITGVKDGVTGPVEIPATYKPEGDIELFYPEKSDAVSNEVTGVTVVINGEGDEDDHGTVTVTEATVETTTTVTLTMAPEAGYELGDVTITSEQDTDVTLDGTGNTRTFVKEAEATYTVTVPFTAIKYTVTVTDPEVGGTIKADKTEGVKGDEITLTPTADAEYTFKRWIVTGATVDENNKFVIGTENVTVTAEFTKNTYAISHDETIATYVGGEVVTVAAKDAEVVIKPVDATKILKNVTVKDADEAAVTVEDNKFTMPGKAVTVTVAEGDLVQGYAVKVATPSNGTVKVDKSLAAAGDTVAITATPNEGYKIGAATVTAGETPVTVDADRKFVVPAELAVGTELTVTVTFVKEEYTITLPTNVINGAIAIKDATEGTKFYYGDTIELTLTPAAGCQVSKVEYTYEGLETPVAIENDSFSMPAKNIEINVTFAAKELPVIGIKAGALNGATGVTAYTVAAGQTRFVAEDGVLFEKVAGTEGAADTLKLIAFPANYTVAENAAKTYTIPATVNGLDVTAVADGAFQALGNVEYVFCAERTGELAITKANQPAFVENETAFHESAAHTKDAGTTVAATCQVAGETTFKCTVCSVAMPEETVIIPIDANAHNFLEANDGWVVVIPATCKQQGSSEKKCQNTNCTYVERRYDAVTGHTFPSVDADNDGKLDDSNYTIDTKATCEDGKEETINTGLKSRHCTVCDAKELPQIEIPALKHTITEDGTNNNVSAKTEATCTEDGSITGNCDHCGKEVTLTLKAKGHEYIRVVDAEPTCTVNGWEHYECKNCPEYKDGSDMELKAPGHIAATVKVDEDTTELKWTIVKAPTCSEDGFAEVRCENCGIQMVDPEGKIEYTRELPATGKHDFGETWTVTKAATCEEEGEETGTCACGYTETRKIDALGHDIKDVDFTVDTEATCKDNGSKSKHCKRCDKKLEVTVITEKGPHKLKEGATETTKATCHNTGLYTGECTVCGDKAATVVIPALDHVWDAEAVNLKTSIQLIVDKVDADGNVVLGEDGKPEKETITASAPTCTADGYKAIYCKNEGCTAHKEDSVVKVDKLGHNPVAYPTDVTPSVKVNATCTSEGTDYRYCDRCKAEYSFTIPMLQHDWNAEAEVLRKSIKIEVEKVENGKVVLGKDGNPVMVEADASAPTCLLPGYTAIYCKTCATYKDVTAVAALGHKAKFADWTKDSTPATCTTKAFETNTCSRCNETMTQDTGDFAACVFETEYTFEYPTCEKAGRKYYKCSNTACEKISGEVAIDALGHKHATDAKWVGTDATCTEDGEKVKECLNLFNKVTGEPYKAPATDDTENNAPATQAEGDTTTGTEGSTTTTPATRPAAPEGYEYCEGAKQVTKATGHAFEDTYSEDLAATCEVPGKESRHCTNEDCDETTGERAIAKLGHNYSTEYKTVTPATCKDEGKEARYCTNEGCKAYTGERKLAKADHTYNDRTWKTVEGKAATCEATGTEYNNCTVCNEYTEREAKALGHKWAETWTIVDATCEGKGQSYKKCERSGCTEKSELEETPALGHKLDSTDAGYTKVTATETNKCTVESYEQGYCSVCNKNNVNNKGLVKINVVAPVGHKFDTEPTSVTAATCEGTGTITGKCAICNQDNVSNTIPALGHTWGDWELAPVAEGVKADCTAKDSLIRKCTVKNCNGSELGKNDNHTESGWILEADATCKVNGRMYTECTVCAKEIKSQTLYATDAHDYEEDLEKRVEPTCNTAGSKTLVCKNCEGKKVEEIAATDHTFTEWKVFVEPTCTEKGIRQSVCTVCLTTKSEKILALGHDLGKDVITAPTCTVEGSKHQECSRCDYKTEATPIAALGHNYTTSNTCSAEGCEAKLYEYKLIGESTTDIEIVKYNPDAKNVVENVVIPSEIDGYIVKAIGDRAFMNIEEVLGAIINEETGERAQTTTKCEKSQFTTVTIPETVTTIGDYAFATASDNFKSVVIPGTVTTIGDYAFGYNVSLNWIDDPEAKADEVAKKVESTPIIDSRVEDFAIYGVKDSAAAVYAAQNPEKDTDDFKFAAIADIYEVAIPEGAEAEKSGDNVVLFKEFAVKNADGTKAPEIDEQIAAVIDINVSGYSVEVVSSQSYEPVDKDGNVIEEDCKYFYGTGTKVLVKEGNNVVDVIEIAVQGDVNGDGAVDALDCMLIQLAAADNSTRPLEGVYYTAGNITADSAITADDLSAAVLKIFGEDLVVEKEEETTVTTTAAPTTEPTTEPTTQAPASTEPSTEGTSGESTPAESTPAATESQPASSEPAATTTTQAPATTTTTQAPAPSESASDTPAA